MRRQEKDPSTRRRLRRALAIRKKVNGTAARPRLSVFRSTKHIYAQLVDDVTGITLAAASSRTKDIRGSLDGLKKSDVAEQVGQALARVAKEKGIEAVVFDRAGLPYHGRVAALAKGARDGGLAF
jgi:large subunit ribosomal protein L18